MCNAASVSSTSDPEGVQMGPERPRGATIIPAADSSGFQRHHTSDARHVSRPHKPGPGDFINYTDVSWYVG